MSEQESIELQAVIPPRQRRSDGDRKSDSVRRAYEAEKALHDLRIEAEGLRRIIEAERTAARNTTVWTLVKRWFKGVSK